MPGVRTNTHDELTVEHRSVFVQFAAPNVSVPVKDRARLTASVCHLTVIKQCATERNEERDTVIVQFVERVVTVTVTFPDNRQHILCRGDLRCTFFYVCFFHITGIVNPPPERSRATNI